MMVELCGIGMSNARETDEGGRRMISADIFLGGLPIGTWKKDPDAGVNFLGLMMPDPHFDAEEFTRLLGSAERLSDAPDSSVAFIDLLYAMRMAEDALMRRGPDGFMAVIATIPKSSRLAVTVVPADMPDSVLKSMTAEKLGSVSGDGGIFLMKFRNEGDFRVGTALTLKDFRKE